MTTAGAKIIKQAFVLGAGLGTRLRPLTEDLPKPLIPIFQKPLITFAFDHLIDIGATRFLVNTHHRAERFPDIFPEGVYRGHEIEFQHEADLLETAGGIANIAQSLGRGPLLVYNGDVLTDLPLAPLLETHFRSGNVVTLALRSNAEPKHVAFDPKSGRVIDIRNGLKSGAPDEFLFTGVYIVDRSFIELLQPGIKRSVIPHFVDLMRRAQKLGGVVIDEGRWWDIRDPKAYAEVHRTLWRGDSATPAISDFPSYPVDDASWNRPVHQTAVVDPSSQLRGCCVIGKNCTVDSNVALEDTIVWSDSQIASRSNLRGCIVRSDKSVSGRYRDIVI